MLVNMLRNDIEIETNKEYVEITNFQKLVKIQPTDMKGQVGIHNQNKTTLRRALQIMNKECLDLNEL